MATEESIGALLTALAHAAPDTVSPPHCCGLHFHRVPLTSTFVVCFTLFSSSIYTIIFQNVNGGFAKRNIVLRLY